MRKTVKRTIALLLVAICLVALGGCAAKTVKMPFGPEERVGEDYLKVASELDKAGFKKVSTEPVNTKHSDNVGKVESVVVDNKSKFKKAESFSENVSVVVRYYKLVDNSNGGTGVKFFK